MRDADRLRSLSETMVAFAESTGDYPRLLQTVVERLCEIFGGFCTIALPTEDGTALSPVAAHDPDPKALEGFRRAYATKPLSLSEALPSVVAFNTGQSHLVEHVDVEQLKRALRPGLLADASPPSTFITCPMRVQGRSVGVLTIGRRGPGAPPLGPDDLELAKMLAHHAALAIANARSLDQARALTQRLRALARTTQLFSESSRDPHQTLQVAVERLSETIGDSCCIRLVAADGEHLETTALVHHPDEGYRERLRALLALPQRLGEGITGRVAATGQRALVPALDLSALPEQHRDLDIGPLLAVPMLARAKILGVVILLRGRRRPPFTDEEALLVQELATHAALAIENARLFAEATKAERRFRRLSESGLLGIVVSNLARDVTDVNDAFLAMLGYDRDDLARGAIDWPAITPAEWKPADAQVVQELRATGVGPLREKEYLRKDGSRVPALVGSAVVDAATEETVSFALDLTDRKRAREAIEANKLKSDFLANMSHELRTPLNAIIGFTELMHRGKVGAVSPQQSEYLGDVLVSGRHLLQLINDVLDLAKIEAGKMMFHREHVELARLVGEVRDVLRGMINAKRLRLEVEVALDAATIDAFRFKQVLYNYLSNAIKFSPEAGVITLRITPEGAAMLRVEVEDRGEGIAPEQLGRLFAEFQQLGPQREGTGLGLALTRRIVEAQGGRVEASSTPGEGSTFGAVLPR